jgi:phosphohistidine phosphatase
MRRRLMLMRHAKSSWKSEAPTDHARPLNRRGREAAPLMADRLAGLGWCPELVIASDSRRTRETWARCAPGLPEPASIRFTPRLYFSGFEDVLDELAQAPDQHASLLALGHNPTWEELVRWTTGHDEVMKTANIALLEASLSSWQEGFATPGRWELIEVLRPR